MQNVALCKDILNALIVLEKVEKSLNTLITEVNEITQEISTLERIPATLNMHKVSLFKHTFLSYRIQNGCRNLWQRCVNRPPVLNCESKKYVNGNYNQLLNYFPPNSVKRMLWALLFQLIWTDLSSITNRYSHIMIYVIEFYSLFQ